MVYSLFILATQTKLFVNYYGSNMITKIRLTVSCVRLNPNVSICKALLATRSGPCSDALKYCLTASFLLLA